MTSYEVIKNLETLFQHLNEHYFESTLPQPYITLTVGAKKNDNNLAGCFWDDTHVNVNDDTEKKYEISIDGKRLGDGN